MYENSDSAGYSWSSADCPCNSSDSGDQCMNTQISFGELSADWENYINEDIYFKPLVQHLKS